MKTPIQTQNEQSREGMHTSIPLPNESVVKLSQLSVDNINVVIQVIDQLSERPVDTFRRLRQNGQENPMTDEEIDDFVSSVRQERYDNSH